MTTCDGAAFPIRCFDGCLTSGLRVKRKRRTFCAANWLKPDCTKKALFRGCFDAVFPFRLREKQRKGLVPKLIDR